MSGGAAVVADALERASRRARHNYTAASVPDAAFYSRAVMCAVLCASSRIQHVLMIWDEPGSCLSSLAPAPLLHHGWVCTHNRTGAVCRLEYSLAQGSAPGLKTVAASFVAAPRRRG